MPGNDDYAAMEEVLTRRLTALLAERRAAGPAGRRRRGPGRAGRQARRRFAYPPQLLLLDGGQGPARRGRSGCSSGWACPSEIPVASLAKSFEEVYLPGRSEPVRLPRQSEALYLLQRLRDEAHRFAISYHRNLRGKRMTAGALDEVAGPRARRGAPAAVEQFGGLAGLRAAHPGGPAGPIVAAGPRSGARRLEPAAHAD